MVAEAEVERYGRIPIHFEVAMEEMEAEAPAVEEPESVLPELPEEMAVLAAQG